MSKTNLKEIAEFFKENPPTEQFEIMKGVRVVDPPRFVENHIAVLTAQRGNKEFMPYFLRLKLYYEHSQKAKKGSI